jgi:hypothetical protein
MCQLHDIEETDVSFAALHTTHIIAMQVGQLRQLFLRELPLQSKFADSIPKQSARVRRRHRAMIGA